MYVVSVCVTFVTFVGIVSDSWTVVWNEIDSDSVSVNET